MISGLIFGTLRFVALPSLFATGVCMWTRACGRRGQAASKFRASVISSLVCAVVYPSASRFFQFAYLG
jgi:hypothetical protein